MASKKPVVQPISPSSECPRGPVATRNGSVIVRKLSDELAVFGGVFFGPHGAAATPRLVADAPVRKG